MQVTNNNSVYQVFNQLNSSQDSVENTNPTSKVNASSFDKIAQKYDMTNISPREIDQLVDELKASGMEWGGDLAMLETRGAKFLSHLAKIGEEQTGIKSSFDPDKKIDLIETIEGNIAFNKQHNHDTEHLESLLKFVRKIDVGSVIPSNGLTA